MTELDIFLNEIEKKASWKQTQPNLDELSKVVDKCLSKYPEEDKAVQERIARGKETRLLLDSCLQIGMDHGRDSSVALQKISDIEALRPDLVRSAKMELEKGDKKKLNFLLAEIEKFASWDPPPAGQPNAAIEECLRRYPDQKKAVQERKERGEEVPGLLYPFHKIGTKYGLKSKQAKKALAELEVRRRDLLFKAQQKIEYGELCRKKHEESRNRKRNGQSVSSVKVEPFKGSQPLAPSVSPHTQSLPNKGVENLHPSDIRGLNASPHWILLIDESGDVFGEAAEGMRKSDPSLGRFAGLLLPEQHGLKPLKSGWHAVDSGITEIDGVIQAVLDAPVGVIGINVQQLPEAPLDRWAFGVLRLIDLVLRLLPLTGSTTLTVQIENRNEFTRNMEWPAVAKDAVLRLTQGYPERAKMIDCTIQVIGKTDSPFNGYVDALAYIWAAASLHPRACLQNTGFDGTCFLPGNAEAIGRAWEWLDRGITLDGADWATLLAQPEAETPGSLTGTILERLGQAGQRNMELWQRYLGYTLDHIASKAVDLKMLGRQVEWLERWSPPGQLLPPPARLLWLTAKLARANHYGQTEQPWMVELSELGDHLLEENAHLVCRAELILAVNATNRYEFDSASRLLERWQDLPKSVPGLRLWAQVQSSLGQHAAFRSHYRDAVKYFDLALEAFAKLSDRAQGILESQQTLTYRAIVLMDNPDSDPGDVRTAVEEVTGPIDKAIADLSSQIDDKNKYSHHLLIRWLFLRGTAEDRSRYLSLHENWQAGEGFPWPLIQLYRGLLLQQKNSEAARELVMEGYDLATDIDQGPTVRLIGACCRAIASSMGEDWPDPEAELGRLSGGLPAAENRIQILRTYIQNRSGDPEALLRAVLPFNFH